MKTRQEMIYEFMLALCANMDMTDTTDDIATRNVYKLAAAMADRYLENL